VGKYCRAGQEADHSGMLPRKDALFMQGNVGKNTVAHSEYVILTAFPQQRWLGESAILLRYTCIACLVVCH